MEEAEEDEDNEEEVGKTRIELKKITNKQTKSSDIAVTNRSAHIHLHEYRCSGARVHNYYEMTHYAAANFDDATT